MPGIQLGAYLQVGWPGSHAVAWVTAGPRHPLLVTGFFQLQYVLDLGEILAPPRSLHGLLVCHHIPPGLDTRTCSLSYFLHWASWEGMQQHMQVLQPFLCHPTPTASQSFLFPFSSILVSQLLLLTDAGLYGRKTPGDKGKRHFPPALKFWLFGKK